MKLLYHKSDNIGDFINEIIFDEIIKLPSPGSHVALGIGTILGLKKPVPNTTYHVFGSGLSSDQVDTYSTFDSSKIQQYVIHGVRGPLTANAIDSDSPPKISSDFAYLLPRKIQPSQNHGCCKVGFVPHKDSLKLYDNWEWLLKRAGISFISPLLPPQEFVNRISECPKVMCEAMHGAILCDAYGIPWIPVFTYSGVSRSKWQDWLFGIGHKEAVFHVFRGPRNIHWKRRQLEPLLGKKFGRNSAIITEGLFSAFFLIRLKLIPLLNQFQLSSRETVAQIQKNQSNTITNFIQSWTQNEQKP